MQLIHKLNPISAASSFAPPKVVTKMMATMLVIVTIYAEIFPVTPVSRVVIVVTIAMMYRKQMNVRLVKLPAAFGAYPTMQLERTITVAIWPGLFGLHSTNQVIQIFLTPGLD